MKKIPVFPIGYGWMVKMKLFDKYFQPYAEYCLRTTLPEDELKEALAKKCPATSDVLSWKAIKAAIGLSKTIVFSCDPDDSLHLHPIKAYRNTSRGDLFIRVKKQRTKKRFCIFQSLKAENTNGCCMLCGITVAVMAYFCGMKRLLKVAPYLLGL